MANNIQSNSFISFDTFFRLYKPTNSFMCYTIMATVVYTTDGIQQTFNNQHVTLKEDTSGLGYATLDDFDIDKYYIKFDTNYQIFKCNQNQLEISGKGKGEKTFTNYKVIIIPEKQL